ncbi:MAG: hypothetical protein SNJ55_07110 [Chloroherpetonaceae bacterium]
MTQTPTPIGIGELPYSTFGSKMRLGHFHQTSLPPLLRKAIFGVVCMIINQKMAGFYWQETLEANNFHLITLIRAVNRLGLSSIINTEVYYDFLLMSEACYQKTRLVENMA